MRAKPIIEVIPYEDIISYECNFPGKFVKILVGTGTLDSNGEFTPDPDQNYEYIIIDYQDFEDLMSASESKPKNVFRKDDLWVYVDKGRHKRKEEYDKFIIKESLVEVPVEVPVKSVRK